MFLSGFIFIMIYNWLNSKRQDISIIVICSLFISTIIKALCSAVHEYILVDISFSNAIKVLVYCIIGLISPFIITYIKRTKLIRKILYLSNYKSINDDAFDDIIDYEEPTMMSIYLKSSDVYYVGKYCYREEKGLDSWIVLINYCCVDRKDNRIIYDPKKENHKSTVMINLNDVERIENIYEDNSKVWKQLSGEE